MGVNNQEPGVSMKITYTNEGNKEIRRSNAPLPSYSALCEHVQSLFLPLLGKQLCFTYEDEDKDTITMSSDAEFLEAKRLFFLLPHQTLHFNVHENKPIALHPQREEYPFFNKYSVTNGTYGRVLDTDAIIFESCDQPEFEDLAGKYAVPHGTEGKFW